MNPFLKALGGMFASKKALAMLALLAVVIVMLALRYSIDEIEQLVKVLGAFVTGPYLLAQGIADHGKERAKIEANGKGSGP